MGLSSKQFANNPTVNGNTVVLSLPLQAAPSSLRAEIVAAAIAAVGAGTLAQVPSGYTGVLISASAANDCFIGGNTAGAGKGILISTGESLFLPLEGAGDVTYQCAGEITVMVFSG